MYWREWSPDAGSRSIRLPGWRYEEHEHFALPLSTLIILCCLLIEARRDRCVEVHRVRVHVLEEHLPMPVLTRRMEPPTADWGKTVAQDLDRPQYETTLLEAIGFRLRRNRICIFLFVLGAWLVSSCCNRCRPRPGTS